MIYLDIIHWVVNPVIWVVLMYHFYGKPRNLSFPFVFMASYLLFIYIQALGIYRDTIQEPLFLAAVWLIPYVFLFVTGIGLALAGHTPRHIDEAFKRVAFSERDRLLSLLFPIISAFFILLPLIFIADKGSQSIAFFYLIFHPGDVRETILLRIGGLNSNIHPVLSVLYAYSRALLIPLYVSILAMAYFMGRVSRLHMYAVLLAGMLYSVLTAAKSPLAITMASMALAYYFCKRGRISIVKGVVSGSIILILPALLYPLLYGAQGVQVVVMALDNLWRRITWVPSIVSALYFDAFQNFYDHIGFHSNRILARIFDMEFINVPLMMNDEYLRNPVQGGLVNASYFASFFADWGMLGVVGGTVLVSLCVIWLQLLFDRQNTDVLGTGLRITVLIALSHLMLSNFYATALGRGLLSVPLLLALVTPLFSQSMRLRRASGGATPVKEAV